MKYSLNVKFKEEKLVLEPKKMVSISDTEHLTTQVNESLKNLSWINTLAGHYTKKYLLLKVDLDAMKGEFFMDSKTEHDGKPPSDKTVEMEIMEDKEIIDATKLYITVKSKAERLQKLAGELDIKIGIIRTLMANERAEANLQT